MDADPRSPEGPFPRAPSREEWARMSPEERAAVVDALPAAMTDAEASPPEGDDWVLGVHVGGDRKKDAELNVARYARLGPASTSSTIGPDSG